MVEVLMVGDFLRRLPKQYEEQLHAIRTKEDLTLSYCYKRLQDAYDFDPSIYNQRAHFVSSHGREKTRDSHGLVSKVTLYVIAS